MDQRQADSAVAPRVPVVLGPGQGRDYGMGRLRAVFKADGAETAERYSISEWWLEPFTRGPGAHAHPEDDVFYVLEGTVSLRLGERWIDAPRGSFVLVPGGVIHDFENRSAERAGVLNLSIPGPFELHMPEIVRWFAEHPPGDTRRPPVP
jgi:quercetin dioxygenase-like cupin family protein